MDANAAGQDVDIHIPRSLLRRYRGDSERGVQAVQSWNETLTEFIQLRSAEAVQHVPGSNDGANQLATPFTMIANNRVRPQTLGDRQQVRSHCWGSNGRSPRERRHALNSPRA